MSGIIFPAKINFISRERREGKKESSTGGSGRFGRACASYHRKERASAGIRFLIRKRQEERESLGALFGQKINSRQMKKEGEIIFDDALA